MEPGKASSLADLVSAVSNLAAFSNAELDIVIVGYPEKNRRVIVYPGCTSCKRKVNTVETIIKCEHCLVLTEEKFYFRLLLQINDESDVTWVTAWEPCATSYWGFPRKSNNAKYMRVEQIVDMGGAKVKKNIPVTAPCSVKKKILVTTPVEDDDDCFEVSVDFSPISTKHYQSW
ncbi:hypothetical protein R1sor_011208 [Riccia sorocarpa]|uniref:Replication factor A C-terminal domain-containing protein n=1 Tax=Riccia sorocarpa TaxID=122646 RepID=A0ABD3I2Z8_9MARC